MALWLITHWALKQKVFLFEPGLSKCTCGYLNGHRPVHTMLMEKKLHGSVHFLNATSQYFILYITEF